MNFRSKTLPVLNTHNSNHISLSWLQSTFNIINKLVQEAIHYLSYNNEPRITQRTDQNGNTFWIIYDPRSNQHIICSSEAEGRLWLEQFYKFR